MPSRSRSMTRLSILPLFSVWVFADHLFPDLILFGYHLDEVLHCRPLPTDCDVVAAHGCHDVLSLDAASPHARARGSPRQSETAERRYQFLFPIVCGITRSVQALPQQPTHVFVTWLVVLGWKFDEYFSSCWNVKVRPPHVDHCQYLALTFARCDLSQNDIQRLQWRCRRIQLWSGVSCIPSQPISRAREASLAVPCRSPLLPFRVGTSLGTLVHIL